VGLLTLLQHCRAVDRFSFYRGEGNFGPEGRSSRSSGPRAGVRPTLPTS